MSVMIEPPDRRLNWFIAIVTTVPIALVAGVLAPLSRGFIVPGKDFFWIALAVGEIATVVVNCVWPKYENASGRWRSFYGFLLRQMPPPE